MQSSVVTEKQDPWFRNHLIRDAIGLALYEEMMVVELCLSLPRMCPFIDKVVAVRRIRQLSDFTLLVLL